MKAKHLAASYWPLVPLAVAVFLLLVLDLRGSSYWQGHPAITNLVTDGVMVLAVAYGLDRVLAARSRRQWRPLGLFVADEFQVGLNLSDAITARTLDYCQRTFGRADIPVGMRYPDDIVPLALSDSETWAGDKSLVIPGLLEEAEEIKKTLEAQIAKWAPVLISEPELAAMAVNAIRLLQAIKHFVFELETAYYLCHTSVFDDIDRQELFSTLFLRLDEVSHQEIVLLQSITLYKTRQPLQPWPSRARADDAAFMQ